MKPDTGASRQMIRFSPGRKTAGAEAQGAIDAVRCAAQALRL